MPAHSDMQDRRQRVFSDDASITLLADGVRLRYSAARRPMGRYL